MTLSFNEWLALIGLVFTVLGLLSGWLIYIIRLEGSTKVIATKVEAVEQKINDLEGKLDHLLAELILAFQTPRPRQPRAVAAGKGRVGKPTKL